MPDGFADVVLRDHDGVQVRFGELTVDRPTIVQVLRYYG